MYDLKYTSNFYNIFDKLVEVEIYKKDYGTHDPILIRNCEVSIEVNYQDEDTPVIGTGLRVVIINQGEFSSLDDLLTSTERQFLCVIKYSGTTVFQGYSICDLNEQQFLPFSKITLQFTDYLRRLDSYYLECLSDMGANTDILTIIHETIQVIGLDYPLYVNSSLFETRMDKTATDTFLEQTFIENNILFTNTISYADTYSALNRILKSFNIYLYSLGDKWIMERLDDITRTGTWVVFSDMLDSAVPAGGSTASLKAEYNKQNGDFQYVEESQVIEYDSGLKTLILDLKDNQLATFVFNNFTTNLLTIDKQSKDTQLNDIKDTLALRTWYIYKECIVNAVGISFRAINQYIKWSTPVGEDGEFMGLTYEFEVTFNITEETPTILSIAFKMAGDQILTHIKGCDARFVLMFVGGTLDGYYIVMSSYGIMFFDYSYANLTEFNTREDKRHRTYDVSVDFNLTDSDQCVNHAGDIVDHRSLWSMLGKPAKQKFLISFLPLRYVPDSGDNFSEQTNYIGDIVTTITQQTILNKLTYYINQDFMKTQSEDMDFFDLDNMNFSNGLLMQIDSAMVATAAWETYQYDSQILMDIYARVKFGNYCKTLHKLKSKILFDGHLKPFSILTDNNMGAIPELLLHGYTWDLNEGTYEIEAVEYTDAQGLESSDETTIIDTTGEIPPVPTGLTAYQEGVGGAIMTLWPFIAEATGYRLLRRPYSTDGTTWIGQFKEIYSGSLLTFTDTINVEGTLANGAIITYKLSAYNNVGESLAGQEVTVTYQITTVLPHVVGQNTNNPTPPSGYTVIFPNVYDTMRCITGGMDQSVGDSYAFYVAAYAIYGAQKRTIRLSSVDIILTLDGVRTVLQTGAELPSAGKSFSGTLETGSAWNNGDTGQVTFENGIVDIVDYLVC